MRVFRNYFYVIIIVLLCCKKPYYPTVLSSPNSYLVVEGVINSGSDSTIIKISKTVKLNEKIVQNPLLGATVNVESDQNTSFPLNDATGKGFYSNPSLNLPSSSKYRLRIKTNDGSEYVSDFVAIKPTPPIDSIGFTLKDSSVNIYVNTHDPANATRYYRWDYDETWQFQSKFGSSWILDRRTDTFVYRPDSLSIHYCFGNDTSSTVLLNSTTRLTQDAIYQSPITQFSYHSEKIETKYSIKVKQYALTREAFEFYQNIKKNTETLGSIFDAQPTELIGNIHNVTNSSEPVIGYITATNVQSKRIFISNKVLPPNTRVNYPYDCVMESALFHDPRNGNMVQTVLIDPPFTDLATYAIYGPAGIIGFMYSTPLCVDCTLRGTKKRPEFWR